MMMMMMMMMMFDHQPPFFCSKVPARQCQATEHPKNGTRDSMRGARGSRRAAHAERQQQQRARSDRRDAQPAGGPRDLPESATAITGAPPQATQDRRPRGKHKHRQQQQQAQRAVATRHRQMGSHLIGHQQTVRGCATINGTVWGVIGVHCVATCTFLAAIRQTIHQFSIEFRQQSAVELSLSVG